MLQRLNISFVSVDRPGHGLSDPQPNRTLLGWADDIRQLADHLQVDQFYVEGWSAGGSYALAIAHELQDRVIKGATLSGIGPYDRPDPYEGLTPQIAAWMEDARNANMTALLAFREQFYNLLNVSTAQEIGSMLAASGGGVDDKEVAQRPDLQLLMGTNFKEGYAQGYEGPAVDDLVINQPWGFQLQDIQTHFDVWQGEVDTNVPMNQGVYQASILNSSRLILLENTAHLFPLTTWEEILVELTNEGEIINTTYGTVTEESVVTSNTTVTNDAAQNATGTTQNDDVVGTNSTDNSSSSILNVGVFFMSTTVMLIMIVGI